MAQARLQRNGNGPSIGPSVGGSACDHPRGRRSSEAAAQGRIHRTSIVRAMTRNTK
nr:MAG TPA: hypothetical protein [Caudoviricetes sp.]